MIPWCSKGNGVLGSFFFFFFDSNLTELLVTAQCLNFLACLDRISSTTLLSDGFRHILFAMHDDGKVRTRNFCLSFYTLWLAPCTNIPLVSYYVH